MTEGEDNRCYDIIDGERIFLQDRSVLRQTGRGKVRTAPCDVLITRKPLRIRQPGLLFISGARYGDGTPLDANPLTPSPELVVEVLSASVTRGVRRVKIADFCLVDVRECGLIRPQAETVEVLRLTADGPVREALYEPGQTLQCLTFPDLSLALDDIFRIEE